jgi:hypothetical protein
MEAWLTVPFHGIYTRKQPYLKQPAELVLIDSGITGVPRQFNEILANIGKSAKVFRRS